MLVDAAAVVGALTAIDTSYPRYCAAGMLSVQDEQDTVPPDVMAVSFRFMVAPEVLTEPSITAVVASLLNARKNVAVPVAMAVPLVIALAVFTPEAAAPKAVALRVSVASKVFPLSAVSGVAGCVPV